MLALLFPGQGSQRPGMGAAWRHHPSWSAVEEVADATGRDVAHLLVDADTETLRETRNAQLAAYTLGVVILDALGAQAGAAGATAGHSLGEYTALVAAGGIGVADGARLVAARSEAMQLAAQLESGTMAAVLGLEYHEVVEACGVGKGAWVANDNAPGQVVVAGTEAGVALASETARTMGAKRVMSLSVGGAFHSPLMAPAQVLLDAALGEAAFSPTSTPLVANVDAAAHTEGFADLLSAQLVSPVRWRESLLTLASMGVERAVELGPGTELSGMVKRTVAGMARSNIATPGDLATAW